jgi:uncharacterized protein YbjT (DUF2867 family)
VAAVREEDVTDAPLTVLLFGATGAAGGSVLKVSLASPAVGQVRAFARRPLASVHTKLRTVIHEDYLAYESVRNEFRGVDACFFCLGISATQVPDETAYRRITQEFALAAARMLQEESPGAHFHYLSGGSASLESRMMWARVKAEAERDLMALVNATCWRPAFIDGEESASQPALLRWSKPVFRLLRPFRGLYVKGDDIGRAMIHATRTGLRGRVIENPELRDLAEAGSRLGV